MFDARTLVRMEIKHELHTMYSAAITRAILCFRVICYLPSSWSGTSSVFSSFIIYLHCFLMQAKVVYSLFYWNGLLVTHMCRISISLCNTHDKRGDFKYSKVNKCNFSFMSTTLFSSIYISIIRKNSLLTIRMEYIKF